MLSPRDIDARLKALREEAHLSAEVAARAAGVSAEELLGTEVGEGRSLSVLIRVAQVYGLTEVDLYAPQAPASTAVSVILRGDFAAGMSQILDANVIVSLRQGQVQKQTSSKHICHNNAFS